jgi:hypothetical protein
VTTLKMGWAQTAPRMGERDAADGQGTPQGPRHAVRADSDVALCGAHIVTRDRPDREWPGGALAGVLCADCRQHAATAQT